MSESNKQYVYIIKRKTWISDGVICCHLTKKEAIEYMKYFKTRNPDEAGMYQLSKHVLYG